MFKKTLFAFFLLFAFARLADAAYLQILPEYPQPNEEFEIALTLEQGEFAPNVSWFKDDELLDKNSMSIKLKAPDFGASYKIKAMLNYANKKPALLEKEIKPIYFDILYETESFVPDFLNMAPLASYGSNIKLEAIVRVPETKNEDILFVWKKDDKKLPYASGFGKNKTKIESDFYAKYHKITMELWSKDEKKLIAKKDVFILINKPELLLYVKTPLLSWAFEKSVKNRLYLKDKEDVLAIPLYFSVSGIFDPLIDWVWSANGKRLTDHDSNYPFVEISFSKEELNRAEISLFATHKKHVLQNAHTKFTIERENGKNKIIKDEEQDSEESGFGI